MSGPRRIQRQRTKGWRMPENTVYVGRPSKWGNPFNADHYKLVLDDGRVIYGAGGPPSKERQAELFALFMQHGVMPDRERTMTELRAELAGKNLACWCPLTDAQGNHVACHADVLLELANGGAER